MHAWPLRIADVHLYLDVYADAYVTVNIGVDKHVPI
jgi:hypothetical protein